MRARPTTLRADEEAPRSSGGRPGRHRARGSGHKPAGSERRPQGRVQSGGRRRVGENGHARPGRRGDGRQRKRELGEGHARRAPTGRGPSWRCGCRARSWAAPPAAPQRSPRPPPASPSACGCVSGKSAFARGREHAAKGAVEIVAQDCICDGKKWKPVLT